MQTSGTPVHHDFPEPLPAERRILEAINSFDALTAAAVCQWLYPASMLRDVQRRLQRLVRIGYLDRLPFTYRRFFGSFGRGGTSPALYGLSHRGWAHCKAYGLPVAHRFHSAERKHRSQRNLEERFLSNLAVISAAQLCRTVPSVRLGQVFSEWQLKRRPSTVRLTTGKRHTVIPDGWVQLTNEQGEACACFAYEVDMGSETNKKRVQEKLEALILWNHGPYQADFGSDILQVLFFAVPGVARRDELRRWAQEVFVKLGRQDEADLLLFSSLSPAHATVRDIYFSPVWYAPFAKEPQALFP